MSETNEVLEFRTAVARKAAHLPNDEVKRAVDWYARTCRIGKRHQSECVELAGQFSLAAAPTDRARVTPLSRTPFSEYMGQEWVRVLNPRIEAERDAIWGNPDPPWNPTHWEKGVQWLLQEERRARAELGISDGEEETGEARQLWNDLLAQLPRLQEVTGHRVSIHSDPLLVLFWSDTGEGRKWMGVEALGSPSLQRISRLCKEVNQATGFAEQAVTAWMLFGVLPIFTRAQVETLFYHVDLPGTVQRGEDQFPAGVQARAVTVTFRTPDLSTDDLRRLRDAIRTMWSRDAEPSKGHRFTQRDVALLQAWRDCGGPSAKTGVQFWEDVRVRWDALFRQDPEHFPPPPKKAVSVRRYWYRIQDKQEILKHLPAAPKQHKE